MTSKLCCALALALLERAICGDRSQRRCKRMRSERGVRTRAVSGAGRQQGRRRRRWTGWKTWRALACERCHGAEQEGLVGPPLVESLKTLSKEDFHTVIMNGRPEKGMPPFNASPMVNENWEGLYAYLKGRSDGQIAARPADGRSDSHEHASARCWRVLRRRSLCASQPSRRRRRSSRADDTCCASAPIPNNLPLSNRRGEGYENKIAEELARDLGRKLEYTYFPQRMGFVRNTLRQKDRRRRSSSSAT